MGSVCHDFGDFEIGPCWTSFFRSFHPFCSFLFSSTYPYIEVFSHHDSSWKWTMYEWKKEHLKVLCGRCLTPQHSDTFLNSGGALSPEMVFHRIHRSQGVSTKPGRRTGVTGAPQAPGVFVDGHPNTTSLKGKKKAHPSDGFLCRIL